MTKIKILNKQDIEAFNSPPRFNSQDRLLYFILSDWEKGVLETFRSPSNKVAFILQLGYFKATKQFFNHKQFCETDIIYISKKLNIRDVDLSVYNKGSFTKHKSIILSHFGYMPFDRVSRELLIKEAEIISLQQQKPKSIFFHLVSFLETKKIEVPMYNTFAEVITNSLNNTEKQLISIIKDEIKEDVSNLLDELLETDDKYNDKENILLKRSKLTMMKKINLSTRPGKIKDNVCDFISKKNYLTKQDQYWDVFRFRIQQYNTLLISH
jgi:hypothetical protein